MPKKAKLYLVVNLFTRGQLSGKYTGRKINFSWAPGMVGVMPVFNSKEDALAFEPDERFVKLLEPAK